jgi:Asp-tRNA(Asn)/Glu-tRNA(Gln) amidotransferase A subunit family amidase
MRNGPVLLDSYVPDEDATVVEQVLDASATILGKAVCEPVLLRAATATPPAGLRAHGCRR